MVLVGTSFWSGLLAWMESTLRDGFRTIGEHDLELFHLTDDVEEAVDVLHDCCTGKRPVAPRLPRFPTDELVPSGEGTRLGVQPRRGGLGGPALDGVD